MSIGKRIKKTFAGDFETTVYKNQTATEVWASALVEIGSEDVNIFHSIEETWEFIIDQGCDCDIYYHNLKFDGHFWLWFLMFTLKYKQSYEKIPSEKSDFVVVWNNVRNMKNKEFIYTISNKGLWYTITIKVNNHIITLKDSMKLLPMSISVVGKSFGTKHKKSTMEYTGFRYAGCEITDEEKSYLANDVLVLKEALEIMFADDHKKLTIGACCLSEYKNIIKHSNTIYADYKDLFPDVYDMMLDKSQYDEDNAGDYIRHSYRGGWCYVVSGKDNRILHNGITVDVNSLYPSMMHSMSGNIYPIGKPHFWKGSKIPYEALLPDNYYFIRFRSRFTIKDGYLPFVQVKNSSLYKPTEMLKTSDVLDLRTGEYHSYYKDEQGCYIPAVPTLTMTCTDWVLFNEHYNLDGCEILDGCWFRGMKGIFDEYVDKYATIKKTSKGAKRQEAKLFLNNLYGKMASSTDSSFKVATPKDDQTLGFIEVIEHNKQAGFIPVGSAITSYSRNFTIRAAQKNYFGADKKGFCYADTDSIHCDYSEDNLKGVKLDPTEFCCWKVESYWDDGYFTRQKTYIEHVVKTDDGECEPWYNIKCAGMSTRAKNLFAQSLRGDAVPDVQYTDAENEFLFDEDGVPIKRTMSDFKIGLTVPGNLRPRQIPGGVVLMDEYFEMRK